uniref:RING-type domain-containing protein n=1 Tax=Strongyloides papillosus TaxID=174720 RepID=A0A0N5BWQ0_STREA
MDKLIKEITCLQEWSLSTASIIQENSPKIDDALVYPLPFVPRNSFKIAVSKNSEAIVTITPDRVMRVNGFKDDKLVLKSVIKLKQDILHDQAILQYSESGQLILITRSFGFLDIFDVNGVFKNTIKVSTSTKNIFDSISCIQSVTLDDEHWTDKVFILQCNGSFMCKKLSGDGKIETVFNIIIQSNGYISSFHYNSKYNLLITSSVFLRNDKSNCKESSLIDNYGISVYRNSKSDGESFKLFSGTNNIAKKFDSFMGLISSFYKFESIMTFSINSEETNLVSLTNFGKVIISSMPSMKILQILDPTILLKNSNTFVSVLWNEDKELTLLLKTGEIYQENYDSISENMISGNVKPTLNNCLAISKKNKDKLACFNGINGPDFYPLDKKNLSDNVSLFFVLFIWIFSFFQKCYLISLKFFQKEINTKNVEYKSRKIDLSINTIKNTTFEVYLKKLLCQKNYEKAKELAKEHNCFDIDNINKLQWNEAKEPSDELLSILCEIKDKEWVVNECLKCNFSDIDFQLKLNDICNNLKWEVSEELQFLISHNNLIFQFDDWEDMEKFNQIKQMSLLDLGIFMLQEERIDICVKLITSYRKLLRPYILIMLYYIPESVNPRQYSQLLPEIKGQSQNEIDPYLFLNDYDEKKIEYFDKEKELISNSWNIIMEQNSNVIPYYLEGKKQQTICLNWLIKRVLQIDEKCGLANYSMKLSEISTERGFTEMEDYIMHCYFYLQYLLKLNGGVSSTLETFLNMDSQVIAKSVIKHMSPSNIIENIPLLVKIFSYFEGRNSNSCAENDMALIIEHCSQTSMASLDVMTSNFPNFLQYKSIEKCFCASNLKGKPLIDECQKYKIEKEVRSALIIFNQHGVTPMFSQIIESRKNQGKAWNLLMMLIRNSQCLSEQDWKYMIMDVNDIRTVIFDKVLTFEKVNQLLLDEMIELIEKVSPDKIPIHLIKNDGHLSEEKITQLILAKSNHYLNMSLPDINDENLVLAEKVLFLVPENINKEQYDIQKKQLKKVKLALKLGCKRIPTQIIFCDEEELIRELVFINDNYRKVNKLSELCMLFDTDYSKPQVIALCIERAIEMEDFQILKMYIEELMETSRNIATVFNACILLWKSKIFFEMREEILACMLLNCTSENDTQIAFDIMNCDVTQTIR